MVLTLADYDTDGLETEALALLEASGPGTAGGTPYRDSTNGGTDVPIDGELGLGPDDTVISLIRRQSTTLLRLNDRNSPSAFDFGAYLGAGGDGNDLTISLQTEADGLVSWTTAAIFSGNADAVRFTLPSAAQTLLDNLDTGDLFIVAFARPAPVAATSGPLTYDSGLAYNSGLTYGQINLYVDGERRAAGQAGSVTVTVEELAATALVATGAAGSWAGRLGSADCGRAGRDSARRHRNRGKRGRLALSR